MTFTDESQWYEPAAASNETYLVLWCNDCQQDTAHKESDRRCVICGQKHTELEIKGERDANLQGNTRDR